MSNGSQKKEKKEWTSITSLCLGIASVFLWEFSIIPILAVIFGGVGLVRDANKWKAGVGLALGIIFVVVRIAHGHIDWGFYNVSPDNGAPQTSSAPTTQAPILPSSTVPTPTSAISNPDYLKDPSAYLVDYNNKTSSEIPVGNALWIEGIKNSVALKISYTIVKAGQNIIVFHDLQIPGLSTLTYWGFVDKREPETCREKAAVDFLNKNLLHTEVYLAYEGTVAVPLDSTYSSTWRLLMPVSNGKDTTDVALFVIWNGYGKIPFNEPGWRFSKTGDGFLKYPTPFHLSSESTPASELTDAQAVAFLAKRGFWGTCQ